MEDFFNNILNNEFDLEDENIIEKYLDPLFSFTRDFLSDNLLLLNTARKKMRIGNPQMITEGNEIYKAFQNNCIQVLKKIGQIKNLKSYQTEKCLLAFESIVLDSTTRKVLTKLPSDPIDFLRIEVVSESDIDWIMNKIKDYWSKFAQIYAASRVRLILR